MIDVSWFFVAGIISCNFIALAYAMYLAKKDRKNRPLKELHDFD